MGADSGRCGDDHGNQYLQHPAAHWVMKSPIKRTSGSASRDGGDLRSSSILDHGNLPEDPDVGMLRRAGDVWDWDEHRATYELAARRAMVLVKDLRSLVGLEGAIARGLFSVACSFDEDHFAVRVTDGQSEVYKWPTVPSAEESKDVVAIGAFLGAKHDDENILEPQDIPLAVKRALVIRRNVPVLIFLITESGLLGQRFQLRGAFFDRLMANSAILDASENDIQLSATVKLLARADLTARFKDIVITSSRRKRSTLIGLVKRAYGSWVS